MLPSTLFLAGNKRSGSSLLVQLLNKHRDVFVTHESDVMWILYQLEALSPTLKPFQEDGPRGMASTIERCGDILSAALRSPQPNLLRLYFDIQTRLMRRGTPFQPPDDRSPLWLGDKKPLQYANRTLGRFIDRLMPDARFVHLVRHPAAVVQSMKHASIKWGTAAPSSWACSEDELLDRWAATEALVLARATAGGVHTLRFEDLLQRPAITLAGVWRFLSLDSERWEGKVSDILPTCNDKHDLTLRLHGRALDIARHYGYQD